MSRWGRWPDLGRPVPRPPLPATPVLVGTEAVLHRVRRAAAVAFLDIDLHLLAPRLSATEETLALFVRAARLVAGRGTGAPWARLQVQTRVPDHPLLQAVSRGEPDVVLAEEVAVRRSSALPPFAALALVSGTLAPAYAEALRHEVEDPAAAALVEEVACRCRPSARTGFSSEPTGTRPCATSWPARPGPRAGGSASRSTPPRSECLRVRIRRAHLAGPDRMGNRPTRR